MLYYHLAEKFKYQGTFKTAVLSFYSILSPHTSLKMHVYISMNIHYVCLLLCVKLYISHIQYTFSFCCACRSAGCTPDVGKLRLCSHAVYAAQLFGFVPAGFQLRKFDVRRSRGSFSTWMM